MNLVLLLVAAGCVAAALGAVYLLWRVGDAVRKGMGGKS
jgi:hypothetical protein